MLAVITLVLGFFKRKAPRLVLMGISYSASDVHRHLLKRKETGDEDVTVRSVLKFVDPQFECEGELDEILKHCVQHLCHFYVILVLDRNGEGHVRHSVLEDLMRTHINPGKKTWAQIRRDLFVEFVLDRDTLFQKASVNEDEVHAKRLVQLVKKGYEQPLTARMESFASPRSPMASPTARDLWQNTTGAQKSQPVRSTSGTSCSVGGAVEFGPLDNSKLDREPVEDLFRLLERDGFAQICPLDEFLRLVVDNGSETVDKQEKDDSFGNDSFGTYYSEEKVYLLILHD